MIVSISHTHPISDKRLWDRWFHLLESTALSFASSIDLFATIEDNPHASLDLLAQKTNIAKSNLPVLLNLLTASEWLIKDCEGECYSLSDEAKQFLIPSHPNYWGHGFIFFERQEVFERVEKAFLEDKKIALVADTKKAKSVSQLWEAGSMPIEVAEKFTSIMHSTIYYSAQLAAKNSVFSDRKSLLDIGGGSGAFSIALCQEYDHLHSTIYDLEPVCLAANSFIEKANLAHQISTHPGDFFKQDLPQGFDGAIFSNILHDWPPETGVMLIEKAYKALEKGGKIFIHEMLWNEDKTGPWATACFDFLMHVNHRAQQYRFSELKTTLENAGFTDITLDKTSDYYSLITATK